MATRHRTITLILLGSILVTGCGAVAPTATSVPATATSIALGPTSSPRPPTATPAPPTATAVPLTPTDTPLPSPTATPVPPTAVPSATPTPAPLLFFENSPQSFGRTETFQVGLGDLDGDGDLDAVFANMAANDSQVWFNAGGVQGGTPGQFVDSGQRLTQQGHGVDLGDLDGDGDLDIFMTCAHFGSGGGWSKRPSRVYLNDGQGTFEDSGQDLGDTELSGNGVNLIDLDDDGDLDAHVVYYEVGGMADKVYLNDGTGRFTDSGLALTEEEIAWGDLDADGDVDIFAKAYGTGYRVLLNDGTGQFVTGWQMEDGQTIIGDLALTDLDGDGDLDALVANGFRSEGRYPTRLLWNDGTGQFADSGQELNETLGATFAVGDLDRDGSLDVYVSNVDHRPGEAWLNDGTGHLTDSGLRLESLSRLLATWPSLDDLDGDGDLDLFQAGFEGKAEVWLNATPLPAAGGDGALTALVSARTWIRTFEGSNYGAFFDIVLTGDGNFLAVGATNHLHLPPYSGDALLMKLTLEGDVLWERTWGGDGYEQAWSVALAEDGGYFVFGETDSYGAGDRDFFLLKIAQDGSEEWFKTYGRARREWPYGMLRLSNGDLLIYGDTEPLVGSRTNQYALRLGSDGEVIWEYVVESPGDELVIDALETAVNDLVLAVAADEDGKLVKLDADGNVRWTHRYELPGWQFASQVAETSDGGFFLAGFSMSSGSRRQADTWLARCTAGGELEWETSFGDPAYDDYAHSLIRLKDGTYLIGGIGNGMLLSRVDQDGNVLWRRSLVGQTVYGAAGLIELEDGGYLVAGFIQITNGRSYDAILLRTDAEGQIGE
jgi:hypothetical protein